MPDSERLRDDLRQFGFSEKETAVYLALVERGRAEPKTLASDADVSTSYIYEVLDQLAARDLVVVEDHRSPTLVRARPPAEAFETLSDRLDRVETAVEKRYQRPQEETTSLDIVRSRPTFVDRLRDVISQAESEVMLSIPGDVLSEIESDLRAAIERDVLVLIVLSGPRPSTAAGALEDVATVVRYLDGDVPIFATSDRSRGLIAPPSVLAWQHGGEEAIEFAHPTLTSTVFGSFFGLYSSSEALLLRRPNGLPQRYHSIRPAVYDAVLLDARGRSLKLRAQVRPTGSDEPTTTITGAITDIRQSLVDPIDGEFVFENSFCVDTGDGEVSVGGRDAFVEDYEATSLLLYADH